MINKFDLSGWFFDRLFKYRNKCNIFVYNYLIHFLCYIKGVKIGREVVFNGFPIIRRIENSIILIGDNCTFNSAKFSVPAGLQKPCIFVTYREKAEIIFGNNFGASGVTVVAAKKIEIGDNVLIGAHSMIIDTDFHHADPKKRNLTSDVPARAIIIEDNVFIGTNCMILKGITIGKNSVIGANSVVINSIPENSIAIGNPCKVVIRKSWDLLPQ